MPKISVITPCFNYGEYLMQCVNSVLNSSLKDVELILVNDGSTDPKTISVLKNIKESNYKNVKIIDQENKGRAEARNTGLINSNSEYVFFLDADDYIDSNYLEVAYNELEKSKDVSFVCAGCVFFNNKTKRSINIRTLKYDFYGLLFINYYFVTGLYRKADILKIGGFKTHAYEDWELLINLGKNGFIGKPLPYYYLYRRYHANSSYRLERLRNNKRNVEQLREMHKDIFNNTKLKEIRNKSYGNDFTYLVYKIFYFVRTFIILRLRIYYMKFLNF